MYPLHKLIYLLIAFMCIYSSALKESGTYDSYLNIYKDSIFSANKYIEIANTTWKESFISEDVINLVKCIPAYIDDDKDLDLLVLDSESKLYW